MANAARGFLRRHGVSAQDLETVWTAIALHMTPGIPKHVHPVVALVTAGVRSNGRWEPEATQRYLGVADARAIVASSSEQPVNDEGDPFSARAEPNAT